MTASQPTLLKILKLPLAKPAGSIHGVYLSFFRIFGFFVSTKWLQVHARECLAIEVASTIRSQQVIEVLTKLMSVHGIPSCLRSDNGPEFVSTALLQWVNDESLDLLLIQPGKPWQNGTNESFNGKFSDECLSAEWFRNRIEAKVIIEDWRNHYNMVRPHSSLDYKTPMEFKSELNINLTCGAELSRLN